MTLFFLGPTIRFRLMKLSIMVCFFSYVPECFPGQRGFDSSWELKCCHQVNTYDQVKTEMFHGW